MHYHLISIFPEIFDSFLHTSLIGKAQEQGLIMFSLINPRDFCTDKHQQIDDEPYGGGAGMVIKAEPVINSIKQVVKSIQGDSSTSSFAQDDGSVMKVVLLSPSEEEFDQVIAHELVDEYEHLILICGRYEGIDHRVELWCQEQFGRHFSKISLGKYVTLGGEVPAMSIIEATARLIPGVIKEQASRQHESYRPELGGERIEHPHYTRPESVEGFSVPDVLLSGHHAAIEEWREGKGN